MIALTITAGTGTISVTDSGTTGYVLESWNPGSVNRDNSYATSRWLDGASLTSSRTEITTLAASIQVWGTALADTLTKVATIGSALGQFSYTVTESHTGGSAVYTCMPADYSIEYNPTTLRSNMAVINAVIPRQP